MGEAARGQSRRDPGAARAATIARRKRIVQGVNVAIGVGIALLGAGLLAAAVVGLVTGGDGETNHVGLIAIFGAMTWWGLNIAWPELGPRSLARQLHARRAAGQSPGTRATDPAALEAAEREKRVLHLAEKEQGRVTALEVAGRCDLTVDEAKALLNELVLRQVAELHVSDEGVLVYVFPHLMPGPGRARRRRR
jgi:hypothetical protein